MKDKKVVVSSKHGFVKGKSCLINLLSFYNHTTKSLGEGRTVDFVDSDLSKAFSSYSCTTPTDKRMDHGLDKWILK